MMRIGENVHIYKHLLEVGEGAVQAERQALLRLQEEGQDQRRCRADD